MSVRPVTAYDGTVYYIDDGTVSGSTDSTFTNLFTSALGSSNLSDIYDKASITYGVPKDLLLAVTKAESEFDPNVTSKSGAMGLMQLMPETAAYFGVTDAYDPEQNVMAGANYLSQLLSKYNGNVTYAIAAYNAGSNNVDKYDGVPPFEETKSYVDKILSYLINGVKLPDGLSMSGSMSTMSALGTGTDSSPVISFFDSISKIFGYDEYIDFMRMFLEKVNSNMQRTFTAEDDEEKEKYKTDTNQTDSYVAYQNLSRGNVNIFLKPLDYSERN